MTPNNKISAEGKKRIVELAEQGMSRLEIQVETGYSQPSIRRVLAQAGYPSREIRPAVTTTKEKIEEVVRLYKEGVGSTTIAKRLDMNKRVVLNIIAEHVKGIRAGYRAGNVPAEEFIEAWQTSDGYEEVARKLSMTVQAVRQRADKYRSRGIPLKLYANRQDWQELAELAEIFLENEEEIEEDQEEE